MSRRRLICGGECFEFEDQFSTGSVLDSDAWDVQVGAFSVSAGSAFIESTNALALYLPCHRSRYQQLGAQLLNAETWYAPTTFRLILDYQDANNYFIVEYEKATSRTAIVRLIENVAGSELTLLTHPSAIAADHSGGRLWLVAMLDDSNLHYKLKLSEGGGSSVVIGQGIAAIDRFDESCHKYGIGSGSSLGSDVEIGIFKAGRGLNPIGVGDDETGEPGYPSDLCNSMGCHYRYEDWSGGEEDDPIDSTYWSLFGSDTTSLVMGGTRTGTPDGALGYGDTDVGDYDNLDAGIIYDTDGYMFVESNYGVAAIILTLAGNARYQFMFNAADSSNYHCIEVETVDESDSGGGDYSYYWRIVKYTSGTPSVLHEEVVSEHSATPVGTGANRLFYVVWDPDDIWVKPFFGSPEFNLGSSPSYHSNAYYIGHRFTTGDLSWGGSDFDVDPDCWITLMSLALHEDEYEDCPDGNSFPFSIPT